MIQQTLIIECQLPDLRSIFCWIFRFLQLRLSSFLPILQRICTFYSHRLQCLRQMSLHYQWLSHLYRCHSPLSEYLLQEASKTHQVYYLEFAMSTSLYSLVLNNQGFLMCSFTAYNISVVTTSKQ